MQKLLKLISSPGIDFHYSFSIGIKKINSKKMFEKILLYFWLLGPFIYLIERSPADIWLSIFSIFFLIRCFLNNEWLWLKQWWIRFCIIFWIIGIISAIYSPNPFFSISEGLVWIRFPIYAVAAQVWLGRDRDILITMLISMLIAMFLMFLILSLELYFEPKTRLTWPYGDFLVGSYLAKLSLPIFCILASICCCYRGISTFTNFIIISLSLLFSFFNGERMSFLIRFFSGILSFISFKPKLNNLTALVTVMVVLILSLSFLRKDLTDRFITQTIYDNPFANKYTSALNPNYNPYWGTWRSGIQQFLEKPILGIGPSGTRNNCKKLDYKTYSWLPGKNHCTNHPHNYYIQAFAETGLIGGLFGSLMMLSIIWFCFYKRLKNPNCILTGTAFITPLALFFPLQQMGSLYGQWGNLFIWFAIGVALAQCNELKKI